MKTCNHCIYFRWYNT